jgi:hypothetical protein
MWNLTRFKIYVQIYVRQSINVKLAFPILLNFVKTRKISLHTNTEWLIMSISTFKYSFIASIHNHFQQTVDPDQIMQSKTAQQCDANIFACLRDLYMDTGQLPLKYYKAFDEFDIFSLIKDTIFQFLYKKLSWLHWIQMFI